MPRGYLGGVEIHGTTILAVRKDGVTALAGDGLVGTGDVGAGWYRLQIEKGAVAAVHSPSGGK